MKCGKIEMLNMDCMEYMRTVPDKYFDLAIVDPPYGINASKGTWGGSNRGQVTNYGKKDWDNFAPDETYFNELMRASKNQIIWGANHFISKIPLDSSCWIVWDKKNGDSDFADCELAWGSFKSAVRKFEWRWNGFLKQKPEERFHPTQKPIALYQWLLQNYAKPGDKILDTHGGSMSSAIAAHYGGFDMVICELDKEYFEAAKIRFDKATAQEALF